MGLQSRAGSNTHTALIIRPEEHKEGLGKDSHNCQHGASMRTGKPKNHDSTKPKTSQNSGCGNEMTSVGL